MSDLIGNHICWFSRVGAHLSNFLDDLNFYRNDNGPLARLQSKTNRGDDNGTPAQGSAFFVTSTSCCRLLSYLSCKLWYSKGVCLNFDTSSNVLYGKVPPLSPIFVYVGMGMFMWSMVPSRPPILSLKVVPENEIIFHNYIMTSCVGCGIQYIIKDIFAILEYCVM